MAIAAEVCGLFRRLGHLKLHESVAKCGLAVLGHPMLKIELIPNSLRYLALKQSSGPVGWQLARAAMQVATVTAEDGR